MDKSKKKELIERVAHGLDITPDMYNRSESVVRGITAYLKKMIQAFKFTSKVRLNLARLSGRIKKIAMVILM